MQQVDLNLQSAYGITSGQPKNLYEAACQYYQIDWVREFCFANFTVSNIEVIRNVSVFPGRPSCWITLIIATHNY
jgi:hypothetical protein